MTERELTNLMYELLSPEENPERGRFYLELFDKHVLRLEMSAAELASAEVYREYLTKFVKLKDSRKIDLVIITNKRFIPIEVKIGDKYSEQDDQCRDYWLEAEEYHKKHALTETPVLYYLTPQGDSPSRYSADNFGFQDRSTKFIRSDKIDAVAFCSEGFSWIVDCEDNPPPPKDIDANNNLKSVSKEIRGMLRPDLQRQMGIVDNFFTALDNRFDENFCKKYRLKRGGNKRMEIGDCYTYKRYIDRFFGRAFSWPSICLYCTDAAGNVIKLDEDKELWFRVGFYNGECSCLSESTAFCAGFMIFSNEVKEGLYKKDDITPLLGGKNILPQKMVDAYDKSFNGLVGRTDLHDAQGKDIYFTNVEEPKALSEHVMKQIEKLLERFVNG